MPFDPNDWKQAVQEQAGDKPAAVSTDQSISPVFGGSTAFDPKEWSDAAKQQSEMQSTMGTLGLSPFVGLNKGIAAVAGAPVDLINSLIGLSTGHASEKPFLGSTSIKEAMGAIGVNPEDFQPRSTPERWGQAFGEGVTAAVLPAMAAESIPANLIRQFPKTTEAIKTVFGKPSTSTALIGGAGGVGGEMASELVPDKWKGIAGLGGGLVGGLGGSLAVTGGKMLPVIARAHFAPESLAKPLAGKIVQEAAISPQNVEASLTKNEPLLPKVELSGEQASQDAGIAAMNKQLLAAGPGEAAADAAAQQAKNVSLLESGAQTAAGKLKRNIQGAYNLPLTDAQAVSSTKARNLFDSLEQGADQSVKKLWENPALDQARMYKNKSIDQIGNFVNGLSRARFNQLDNKILSTIEDVKNLPGRDIKIAELQDLRSQALAKGREAFRSGNDSVGNIHYALANQIKDTIGEGSNVLFGDKTGAARQAWQDAVSATKAYHNTFNEGFLKSLNQNADASTRKIAIDETFRSMISGKNVNQNIAQLQQATSGQINDHLSDYLVGVLTKDGQKIVTPRDIDNFMQGRSGTISMVPGLRDRLTKLKTLGLTDQLSTGLEKVASNPDALVDFLKTNKPAISTAIGNNNADRAYFSMLENTANRVKNIPPDRAANLDTLRNVAKGNVSDILYGVGTGKIARTAASGLLLKAIESHFGVDLGLGLELATAGATGAGVTKLPFIGKGIEGATEWAFSGGVRNKVMDILNQARDNPTLMRELLKQPDPRAVQSIFSRKIGRDILGAGAVGAEVGEENARPLTIPGPGNRTPRATGGAVNLMALSKAAKKHVTRSTEDLLNESDDTVARALEVANKHI
jgi:hypothetical protein